MDAHVAKTIAAKPELVQISTAYGVQSEGSPVLPRNKYTAIRDDRPKSKDDAKRPEFKECKFTTEAIITEGSDIGTIHKVCANIELPGASSQANQQTAMMRKWKAEQEKQRREQAIANATGLRVLSAIAAAVPVRLLKRDLIFVLEKLVSVLDESRIETLARQHGIRQKRDEGGIAKTLLAFMRRADEGTLSRLMVEATILLAASRQNGTTVLKDAATLYKVDTEAIGQKVKQEFAAKAKAKKEAKPEAKPVARPRKRPSVPSLRGAANLPPLVSLAPKIAQEDTASVSPCTHVPALAPAPARRLRGRTTFLLPAPSPALYISRPTYWLRVTHRCEASHRRRD